MVEIKQALHYFHEARKIFRDSGVRPKGFTLPCQHSLVHYICLIQEFGAPNGLCSSITESHHITAVKKPWRRSNQYEALRQMLLTNQHLDKLAATRVDFVARGLLPASHAPPPRCGLDFMDEGIENGAPDIERVQGSVVLECSPRTLFFSISDYIVILITSVNMQNMAILGHSRHSQYISSSPTFLYLLASFLLAN